MIMACTGGGILVPIFINKIPVPLSQDAYPLAILVSFFLHQYVPVLREVLGLSKLFKVSHLDFKELLDKPFNALTDNLLYQREL